MSQWHREHPELVGTGADPWMIHEDYRQLVPMPESEREGHARCHSTYVQKVTGGEFFATCASGCGSDPFPNRTRLADAEADARAHGDLHHLYPRPELEAWEVKA